MIAIDTNVLVRLLVRDDEKQFAQVLQLFNDHVDEPAPLWVSDVVLSEVTWVLSRTYGFDRASVATALRAMTVNATLALESASEVRQALTLYEQGPADFPDCLLAVQAAAGGADRVVTFDRRMRHLPGVQLL